MFPVPPVFVENPEPWWVCGQLDVISMRAGRGRGLHGVSEQSTKADSRKGRHNQNTRAHALQSARTPARKCARVRRMHTHKHTHAHTHKQTPTACAQTHITSHPRAHTPHMCTGDGHMHARAGPSSRGRARAARLGPLSLHIGAGICTYAQARPERVQRGSGP